MANDNVNTGTIDYGIDLGTTTSSIAKVDGNGAMLVPNQLDNKNFVSSAVWIKKNGTIYVGDTAKDRVARDPENAYAEFKLKMGTDHVYKFKASGKEMTPVELSAEILKNLRQSVKEKHQKDLRAAVITVPADFTSPQTKATTEAAKLAGFKKVILLQEPTAAAMAYGFGNTSDDNEIWLIYDLGGGTFDVSIMKKNQEEIVNMHNEGDSYLGGKLIDWDIVDKILAPAVVEETGLSDFDRGNKKYAKSFAKLKKAAEKAKADLSTFETADIDIESLVMDSDGDMLDFEYEMTRSELHQVMKPYVDRTINYCRTALEDADLEEGDITKIILVGGSTLSPYIHERLEAEFRIPLVYTIDPTTVVARGAALFAGTQLDAIQDDDEPVAGFVSIEVIYDTIGDEDEFDVKGKLSYPDGSVDGYSVEFINKKTKDTSGKIPVRADGKFRVELYADDEENYNEFEIKVYDASGDLANLSPSSINTIKYKIAPPPSEHILSHTIGLGKYGNELDVIADRGTPLPFEFRKSYKSPNTVHSGDSREKVFIPLYEGNKMKADRNIQIGHITITGDDVRRDLPEDSEIELTVSIDESMNVDGNVYIPFLDQDFEESFVIESEKLTLKDMEDKFREQKQRYMDLETKAVTINDPRIQKYFDQIESEDMIRNIEKFLQTSETDVDALDKVNSLIKDFTDILDHIDAIVLSSGTWEEIKRETDDLMSKVEGGIDNGEPQIKKLFEQVKQRYASAVETRNEKLLMDVRDKLQFIFAQLNKREIIMFGFLELAATGEFVNQAAADRLIQEGNDALARGDMDELERILGQMVRILKPDQIPGRDQPGAAPGSATGPGADWRLKDN
jgi:molecular chaperone DnaK